MNPAYWTVFNEERAERAARASKALGRQQPMLARLQAEGDTFYLGHEGGFPAADAVALADWIEDRLPQLLGDRDER